MDLVTVVMPAYNAENYIDESIQSVINQTYKNWELIIVNDGSLDNTGNIIKNYVKQYNQIKIIDKEKNEGTVKGLNSAIAAAEGEYLCWLSADDLYVNDMIETQVAFLQVKQDYDAVFSRCEFINEKSEFIRCWNPMQYINELGEKNSYQPYRIIITQGNNFHGCSMLGKRKAFTNTGEFNPKYRYAHDYEYWLRFCALNNVGFLDKVNVRGREYEGQISKRGFNDLDAIHVFSDFICNEHLTECLLHKGKVELGLQGLMQCFENRIKIYATYPSELIELYQCAFTFFEQYCKDKKLDYNEVIANSMMMKKFDVVLNNYTVKDVFFNESGYECCWKYICKHEKLQGFIINNEGCRFHRYTESNDILRVCRGFERDNLIYTCTLSRQQFLDIVQAFEGKIQYYIENEEREEYKIGFSAFMLYNQEYAKILAKFNNVNTNRTLWQSAIESVIESDKLLENK